VNIGECLLIIGYPVVRGASLSDPLDGEVYARHGRELMGCKSPVREPMVAQVLANGKGGRATDRLKEA